MGRFEDRDPEDHPDRGREPGPPDGAAPAGGVGGSSRSPNAGLIGGKKRELSTNVYRWDPSGRLDVVITEEQLPDPNGLCFSPAYRTLYVISTGRGPGDVGPGGQRVVYAFDVQDQKLGNQRLFSDMMLDGVKCGPDGMRADVFGNLWISSNAPLGSGATTHRRHGWKSLRRCSTIANWRTTIWR